jgi:hypothetical protein
MELWDIISVASRKGEEEDERLEVRRNALASFPECRDLVLNRLSVVTLAETIPEDDEALRLDLDRRSELFDQLVGHLCEILDKFDTVHLRTNARAVVRKLQERTSALEVRKKRSKGEGERSNRKAL